MEYTLPNKKVIKKLVKHCLKEDIGSGDVTARLTPRDARIEGLKGAVNQLKTRLDVYIHDPYIKNKLKNDAGAAAAAKTPEKEEA